MQFIKPKYSIMAIYGNDDMPYSFTKDPNVLIEAAGRTCYKSEDKITDDSADKFVDMLINREHLAMIEHSWEVRKYYDLSSIDKIENLPFLYKMGIYENGVKTYWICGNKRAFNQIEDLKTIKFEIVPPDLVLHLYNELIYSHKSTVIDGLNLRAMTVRFTVDRGVTHEIVRHRPPAFAQESTRYVNYGKKGCQYIIPCWLDIIEPYDVTEYSTTQKLHESDLPSPEDDPITIWIKMMSLDTYAYGLLISKGWRPEQARSILPNSTKTELVVTASFAEWRHICKLRTAKTAHPQMREIMIPMFKEVNEIIPIFTDLLNKED